jgi:hypothetical protein
MNSLILFSLVVIVSLAGSGCSTGPKQIAHEDLEEIERVALVARLDNPDLMVFNHMCNPVDCCTYGAYSGSQQGAVGGLIEGAIIGLMQTAQTNESLKGDLDALRENLVDFDAAATFDEYIIRQLKPVFAVIGPKELADIDFTLLPEQKNASGKKVRDYSFLREEKGIDTVIEVEYSYGLAVYPGKVKPSAVLHANIRVIDLSNHEILMSKTVASDQHYKRSHSVNEFAAERGWLYRREYTQAVYALANLIAIEFGATPSEKHRSYWGVPLGSEEKGS